MMLAKGQGHWEARTRRGMLLTKATETSEASKKIDNLDGKYGALQMNFMILRYHTF